MDYTTHNFIRSHGHFPMQNINNCLPADAHGIARIHSEPKFHGMDEVDMKFQLHCIETEAYRAVLMAFIAQSDSISWGKEGLITELRKELNVTDTEHREFLVKIDSDESVRKIRDWRKGSSNVQESHSCGMNIPGFFPRSMGSAPQKKLKASHAAAQTSQKYASHGEPCSAAPTSQKYPSHPAAPTSQKYASHPAAPTSLKYASQCESYAAAPTSLKYASHGEPYAAAPTSKKYASHGQPYPAAPTPQKYASHGEPYSAAIPSPLPAECRVGQQSGKLVLSSMGKAGKSISNVQASSVRKGRQTVKSHLNDFQTPDYGNVSKRSGSIQICETNKLLYEVERMVYGRQYPDPVEVEKAKIILKKQERSLVYILTKLSDVSDGDESPDQVRHHYSSEKLQGTW